MGERERINGIYNEPRPQREGSTEMTRKQGKRVYREGCDSCRAIIRKGVERPYAFVSRFLFLLEFFPAEKGERSPFSLCSLSLARSLPALELADLHPTTVAIMLVTHQSRL